MAIYQTATVQVKTQAIDKVRQAIEEFVRYVRTNEPRTRMNIAWQKKGDPTCFIHLFVFEDEAAAPAALHISVSSSRSWTETRF